MHQHPRQSPVTASPANSPRTNQHKMTNQNHQEKTESRGSIDRSSTSEQGGSMADGADVMLKAPENSTPNKDGVAKLNQIVQNYFTKAALVILNARVPLPLAYAKDLRTRRVNRWFNVELDETDVTRDDLRIWKSCDYRDNRPPPMVLETYIDAQDLTNNQSLVFIDENGRRWDVGEALNASPASSPGVNGKARSEIIVERWVVQLGKAPVEMPENLGVILPRTYKNSIVLFRSLYTCARLLPAWRFGKRVLTSRSPANTPRLRYRIAQEPRLDEDLRDSLPVPLYNGQAEVVENHAFDPIESPAGPFSLHVTYRTSCDFRIDDSETLLSSRFMGMDEHVFGRPKARRRESAPTHRPYTNATAEAGSLPQQRQGPALLNEQGQAYGSMSTFHQVGAPTGTSPLSALRAARTPGSESPEDSMPKKALPNFRSTQGSRSSLRSNDGNTAMGRRPSVSFMPFKTPSLSASPSQGDQMVTSIARGSSLGKSSPLAVLAEARHPTRPSPPTESHVVADQGNSPSLANSPKPVPPTRYSSSFGHRKAKLSTGGSSRTEDENSSGKASATSSAAPPGSGPLPEGGTSSGSIQADDDNISDFLKMLDQKKDLKSFSSLRDQTASEASTRRTGAALKKFQRMRESNAALSESLSSSLMLHRSSCSSSRQLGSVPAMIAGTSISTASSPGKPISPHTPHTPAIPSRLSANSVAEYAAPVGSGRRRERLATAEELSQDDEEPNPGAIDIPTSPRPFNPSYRRSSSAAQGPRAAPSDDDDIFPFVMRSASLGVEDRQPLSLSALADLHVELTRDESAVAVPSVDQHPNFGDVYSHTGRGEEAMARQRSLEDNERSEPSTAHGARYRPHVGHHVGRNAPPTQGLPSSFVDRGSDSGSSNQRGGGYSFTRPASTFEDDEPLLFAFDPLQQSRRSGDDLHDSA
ncbi:MAG: hypothetical protein Q9163_002527 [Psora crenata]